MIKRTTDIAISLAALLVTSPLFLFIALGIRLDSAGPIIYRSGRTGRYGKPFTMYKFRTMVVNAEQMGGPSTGYHDPRLMPVGFFLRRWKLDELPQFINVLKGEMSVVGPRPEVPEYTNLYNEEEKVILSVRPGITDYSTLEFPDLDKVLGDADPDEVYMRTIWPRKNQLRVKYVHDHTFLKDLAIISRTILAMLWRRK